MFKRRQIIFYPSELLKPIINTNGSNKSNIKKKVSFNEVNEVYYTENYDYTIVYSNGPINYTEAIKLVKLTIDSVYEMISD